MRIKRLVLKNFRNYAHLSWTPNPRINIVTGNNAQGKTNLLEAIFFCTAGRSFRTSRDREMVNWSAEGSLASAEIERSYSQVEVSASLGSGRTEFFLNGKKRGKNKIFQPALSVSFTPADLDLIRGSPSERRRWIDLDLGTFDLHYAYALNKYERVLEQRNNLLKNSGGRQNTKSLMEPWNEQMFIYGSAVINTRIRLLKLIFPHMKEVYSVLTAGKEEVSYNYLSSIPLEKGFRPDDLKGIYEDTVRKNVGLEVERRQSLYGPHRDDLSFTVNGTDVRKFGSRGQQRSVALAMKISVMRLFREEYGEYPLLLLDDVFLELDRQRQKGLEDLLRGEAQVFITSDRRPEVDFNGQEGFYRVSGGIILGGEE